jgi:hypothetical protein
LFTFEFRLLTQSEHLRRQLWFNVLGGASGGAFRSKLLYHARRNHHPNSESTLLTPLICIALPTHILFSCSYSRLESLRSIHALALGIVQQLATCAEVIFLLRRRQTTAARLHAQQSLLDGRRLPAAVAGADPDPEFICEFRFVFSNAASGAEVVRLAQQTVFPYPSHSVVMPTVLCTDASDSNRLWIV